MLNENEPLPPLEGLNQQGTSVLTESVVILDESPPIIDLALPYLNGPHHLIELSLVPSALPLGGLLAHHLHHNPQAPLSLKLLLPRPLEELPECRPSLEVLHLPPPRRVDVHRQKRLRAQGLTVIAARLTL